MFKNFIYHVINVFIFVLSMTCCREQNNNAANSGDPVIIDINETIRNKVDLIYSNILFDSITFVPVESIIDGYTTSLNEVMLKITRNFIFAESYFVSGDLVCYDRDGKFIRKIAEKGRGPGEYNQLTDVTVDEKNGIVYILSGFEKKIFKYSFEGVFLGLISISHPADKIAIDSSGKLLVHFPNWTGDLQYSCLLLDNNGNIVNKLKNNIFYALNAKRKFWKNEGIIYIYNDRIHVKGKCDTLFVVENDQFIPKYVFLTGKNSSNKLSQLEYDEKKSLIYVIETDSKIFFGFGHNKKRHDAYYDKKIGKAFSTTNEIINEMYDRKDIYFFTHTYQYNDEVILRRNSFDMAKMKENVSPSKYNEISSMLDRLDDDPVILNILHLKKQ